MKNALGDFDLFVSAFVISTLSTSLIGELFSRYLNYVGEVKEALGLK